MSSQDLTRWTTLVDRLADGDELSDEEQAFCDRYADAHPECARELALMEELSDLEAAPDGESGALVDAVLGQFAVEQAAIEAGHSVDSAEISEGPRSRLPRTGIALVVAAAAACALAVVYRGDPQAPAVAGLAQPASHPSRLELVYASGDATVDGADAMAGGALLASGDVVEIGEGSACMVLEPNIDVCMDGGTKLRVGEIVGPARRLELLSGRVALRLDKQPQGMSITVVSDGVESTAVGTAFTVARAASGVTTTVMEGRVRVKHGKNAHLVDAHRRVVVEGSTPRHSTLTRADESPEWEMLAPRALWREQVSGELRVSALQAGASDARVLLDGRAIGRAPLSTLLPPGPHELVVMDGERELLRRSFRTQPGQREIMTFDAQPLAAVEEPLPPSEAAPRRRGHSRTPTELLSGARHMMVEGRWGAAAEVYRSLRRLHPKSPEAHTVLVSLGQLELDRLGDPRRALSLLDRYLAKGGGVLAEEARYTRIRALRRLGHAPAEQDAIRLFLAAHPKSFHRKVLERRLVALAGDRE